MTIYWISEISAANLSASKLNVYLVQCDQIAILNKICFLVMIDVLRPCGLFAGHGLDVLDCRGSCDNSLIATASADKSCALFDVQTGRSIRRWRGHAGSVFCVTFNEDASLVLSGGIDGTVAVWDVRNKGTREPVQILKVVPLFQIS